MILTPGSETASIALQATEGDGHQRNPGVDHDCKCEPGEC